MKKIYDKPMKIFKSRDITLLKKFSIIKAMIFPVVMYGCDFWSKKHGKWWTIDGYELRCWTRLFRVPWTARRSNQSVLKEINPEYSLEGLILKFNLQYFGQWMWLIRTDSLEKTLLLGKIEGRRRRGQQRMRCLDGITDLLDMSWPICRSWWRTEPFKNATVSKKLTVFANSERNTL